MRETFDGAWPRLNRGAASMPMAPAKRTLRRVITVHLVDERSSAIVRLQGELSAANDRLLLADLGLTADAAVQPVTVCRALRKRRFADCAGPPGPLVSPRSPVTRDRVLAS